MRLIQTGRIGVLQLDRGLRVENVVAGAQLDEPNTPVVFGYNTVVTVDRGVRWKISGPNLSESGVGAATVAIPVGEYEITIDTA